MGEISYKPLLEDMTWSYSRVNCFNSCPYQFYLKYIAKVPKVPQFYSSFGSFMHSLLEQYYKGEIEANELVSKYTLEYLSRVEGERPRGDTATKYFNSGLEYFQNFKPFDLETVAVEKRINFKVGKYPFQGIIDYIGKKSDELHLIDHKSRLLKPRSRRRTPTVKDKELDEMQKQLYLYSFGMKESLGEFPDYICFNCFRNGNLIKEPFDIRKAKNALNQMEQDIEYIINTEDFHPTIDWFFCHNLCDVKDECCYCEEGRN